MTKIIQCKCEHEQQDKMYGKQKRVHNQTRDGWRCTVCKDVKKF